MVKLASFLSEGNSKTALLLSVSVQASVLWHLGDGATEQWNSFPIKLGHHLDGGFTHHAYRHCLGTVSEKKMWRLSYQVGLYRLLFMMFKT